MYLLAIQYFNNAIPSSHSAGSSCVIWCYLFQDKHWILRQVKQPMGNDSMVWVDSKFRDRWRTLLSVDDMIENVVNLLDKYDALNNTYIIFASDNGYHLGECSSSVDDDTVIILDLSMFL